MQKNTYIIIPAYNESKNIEKVIKKTKKYCKNIIIVDDGSSDNTYLTAKKTGVIVLGHIVNLGKGAALKTGCDFAIKKGAEIIISLDADGQHDPKEIPKFLEALKDCNIVLGYRKLNKKMPLVLKLGNWFISFITRFLYRINIKDTQCGYRAYSKEAGLRLNTFGNKSAKIRKVILEDRKNNKFEVNSDLIPEDYSREVRSGNFSRIDIYLT